MPAANNSPLVIVLVQQLLDIVYGCVYIVEGKESGQISGVSRYDEYHASYTYICVLKGPTQKYELKNDVISLFGCEKNSIFVKSILCILISEKLECFMLQYTNSVGGPVPPPP